MTERIVWASFVFFCVLDLYLVAERVEQAAQHYHLCRRCERWHSPDRRAVEAHPRMVAPMPPARRPLPVDAAGRELAASTGRHFAAGSP